MLMASGRDYAAITCHDYALRYFIDLFLPISPDFDTAVATTFASLRLPRFGRHVVDSMLMPAPSFELLRRHY